MGTPSVDGFSLLVLLSLALLLPATVSAECSVPSSFWCDHAETARECGVTNQCQRLKRTTTGPQQRTNVTVIFETHCPHCQNFIVNTLYPMWRSYKRYVHIEFVPWGNAKRNPVTKQITCLHGSRECEGMRLLSCTLDQLGDRNHDKIHFTYCIMKHLFEGIDLYRARMHCFRVRRFDYDTQRAIKMCYKMGRGEELEYVNERRTAGVHPETASHTPWIVVNGRSTRGMQTLKYSIVDLLRQWHDLRQTTSHKKHLIEIDGDGTSNALAQLQQQLGTTNVKIIN